ncbi:unnamed protein product [Cylindrotheca closterium]|uniref:Uncharacterized protein n=1 Tax=Cylindrotheca closterium TaxID=2856 RepID=A0AAD2JME3_9STRA|nr:unnamed protein product [Cylindrotheca closterium]
MGTTQSTRTNAKEITFSSPNGKNQPSSVSGRKTQPEISYKKHVVFSFNDEVIQENEEESVTDYDDTDDSLFDENEVFDFEGDTDDDDEEEDEEWNERLAILQDARNLKQMADFYLNPHKPVVSSPEFMGRNFFERPSAPDMEDEEERALILNEARALKQLAVDYLHPEKFVVTTDATVCGRNYFDRASAPETLSHEEAEEQAQILEDARALKQLAVDYMHPELTVKTTDAFARGRNYFTRPSAPEQEQEEDMEERDLILQEMALLKRLAIDYLHPELPVVTSDPTACGRNYFTRASAEEYEEEEMMDDREDILNDMAQLKRLAMDYLQPERPVQMDSLGACRNYFDRPSAPETVSREEADEQARILADARALKQLAVDYMHPELPVVTSDPCACGRNYFSRPSAEGNDDSQDEEWEQERASILQDMQRMKQLAVDYLHPELAVQTTDPTACGRNYFCRYSAEEYDEKDEERDMILQEMKQLKKLAVDYLHPELPVKSDGFATARNYFTRFSAEEQEEEEMMDEREDVLEDVAALKKLAMDYLQPERPVVVDALASSRNYFDRASAEPTLDYEEAEEQARILADAAALKQLAVDYMHPELPVKTTDAFARGRNYFTRPSAPEQEQEEDMEERDLILQEMALLKQLAVDYLHPELPVVTSDPTACGRNYFTRASAEEYEEEEMMDDREDILNDMAQLKRLAMDYLQPERPVQMDSLGACRNYFDRPSAPETVSREEADEQARILADARALKQLAVDYMHPELPVVTSDPCACGRNYFSRPSAEGNDDSQDEEWEQERASILQDMQRMKQLAVDYLHPELAVQTTDPTACGRNYFCRYSAEEYDEKDEERDMILQEMKQLKKLAVDYLHPELPVKSDGFAAARNYFTRPSAPEQVTLEDAEEEVRIRQDLQQMKKLAEDYLHPETPVKSNVASVRCYFDRASAYDNIDHVHTRRQESDDPAAGDSNHDTFAYHEQVLGLVSGDHDYYDHSEHFDMDMDEDLQTFKDNLRLMSPNPQQPKEKAGMAKGGEDEEDEGNLSRSPSSIMLFELAGC